MILYYKVPQTPSPTAVRTDGHRPASGRPAARLDGVSMTFPNGTTALEDVSLEVAQGEFVSLLGPSGCGKSTILRLLAGFEAPTAGTVQAVATAPGYVFQEPTLLPWRTALANVVLPARLRGASRSQARASAHDALERVGLSDFAGHRPSQLSGGMKMRVAIARAMTMTPELFLFDEPFGALDEITRSRLNEELAALFVAEQFAGIFVTHSVAESIFMSTRVLVMAPRPGRIVADIEVPFGYPRAPELRYRPEFAELAAEVSATLRAASE
ncbi:ABC transporter ATP-binding protein [soil metagenome]